MAVFPLDEVRELISVGMSEENIAEKVAEKLSVIPPEILALKNALQIPQKITDVEPHLFVRVSGTERNHRSLNRIIVLNCIQKENRGVLSSVILLSKKNWFLICLFLHRQVFRSE